MSATKNWKRVTLGDLCQTKPNNGLFRKKAEYATGDVGVPVVWVKELFTGNEVDVSGSRRVEATDNEVKKYGLKYGDLLFCRSSLNVDGIAYNNVYLGEDDKALFECHLIRVAPDPEIACPKYLNWLLRSPPMRAEAKQNANTATMTTIDQAALCSIEFELPPLSEQKRIAGILDKADSIVRKRQQAIGLTEQFLRSTFLDMFGDPVTNPKGWPKKRLDAVATVTTGNTPSRKSLEYYGDHIEWIKSDNINNPSHYLTNADEYLSKQGKSLGRSVEGGSTLMTCIAGSKNCIGNVAMTDREVAFNQQINAITPFDCCDPHFIYVLFWAGKRLVQRASTESMKGMVSKGKLSAIEVIVPPKKEQQRFGDFFQSFHDAIQQLGKAQSGKNNLFNSLVQRAFRGEL